jgi:hypothetical protein
MTLRETEQKGSRMLKEFRDFAMKGNRDLLKKA